jgi:hypothetical protein
MAAKWWLRICALTEVPIYLNSVIMKLYQCLANKSLIIVLIHISVIKYVLISTMSRDT